MNRRVIDYIQAEAWAVAIQKYPNDRHLQWIYVHGFITAQLALAVEYDTHVIYRFKAAVREAKSRK